MSWGPSDEADYRESITPSCPHCRGNGYLPATHSRGAVPCGCDEVEDEDEPARCDECGEADDDLRDGLCWACEENAAPSASELYASERTW